MVGVRGRSRRVVEVDADKSRVGFLRVCCQGERFVVVLGEIVSVIA